MARYHEDPRCTELDTRVLRCEPHDDGGYRVFLEDTILYPEGGGQPPDHGRLGEVQVVDVQRLGDGTIAHATREPVPSGETRLHLDWGRRFDHMQQHSGQHLLSAVAEDQFGWPTTAFHLGPDLCDVELDVPSIAPSDLRKLEDAVNAEIRRARPVGAREVSTDEYASLPVRSRGLPAGFQGPVRLVEIEGVDLNTCGGTHVSNTAELQSIVLVRTERMRGGTRVYFLAGDRVRMQMGRMLERQERLTQALGQPPEQHLAEVDRVRDELKSTARAGRVLADELATSVGEALAAAPESVATLHRDGADLGFLAKVAQAARANRPDLMLVLTTGAPDDGGFLVVGPAEGVDPHRNAITAAFAGRGGGKGGRVQGKATRLAARDEVAALLRGESPGGA